MDHIVFYSSDTGNTYSFIKKLGMEDTATRLPTKMLNTVEISKPYILFIPTYASNDGRGALPKSVVKFLNIEQNRNLLKGIIASGNKSFGRNFCLGGDLVSQKCGAPVLYKFELRGTAYDASKVMDILNA